MDWSDLESLAALHTVNEIARIKQCRAKSVRRALQNAGLTAKDRNEDFHRKIEELYIEKRMSAYEIAELLHRPRPTISKYLADAHLSRSRPKALKLAFKKSLHNSFVCHICHRRKNLSKLTKSTRFSGKFGCRECIEKNDGISGTIIPPAQPGEKVPHGIPPPRVHILSPSGS